ncbi:TPA: hypothetical protein SAY52_005795 [Burkholderia cenocepacia]|uniref:tetratricopeptide repeat protein n=1 Tax=unclassified Burkholderia TaxID=2613784 RepID=UPI001589EE8A|nr:MULTISPECIES: hypothetical protein [unclassified Burkholderia]HEF5875103.1 hypothetical protein [Burkholderia cenocepacia]
MNRNEYRAALCDDDTMSEIVRIVDGPDSEALEVLSASLTHWPDDHRLWFLRGSIYAGNQRRAEARVDFARAIVLAPDFAIAHFMLGLVDLLDGHVQDATAHWEPLDDAHSGRDALQLFKTGLLALCDDRFDVALDWLKQGIAVNERYPGINAYMESIVEQIDAFKPDTIGSAKDGHLLLAGYLTSRTRH